MLSSVLAFGAAMGSGLLAVAAAFRKWRSPAARSFFVGMGLFAIESALGGFSFRTTDPGEVSRLQTLSVIVQSLLPGTWVFFSLTYSRGNQREVLAKWRFALLALLLVPAGLAIGFRGDLIEVLALPDPKEMWWLRLGAPAKAVEILILIGAVLVLMNLETTMRAAVGTMRWRIKFMVLGLGVIFGTRIYTCSQALLFSGKSMGLEDLESSATLIGCVLIGIAYLRSGFVEVDVYPSRAVLSSSITALLVGAYLFIVGVLAEVIAQLGGIGSFQAQAVLVMAATATLAVLLSSDRLRQGIREFVSRNFARPQHDSRKIWSLATREMASVLNPAELCAATARLISGTFEVLSVSVWLVDEVKSRLIPIASTSSSPRANESREPACPASDSIRSALAALSGPFDLEAAGGEWAGPLKDLVQTQFPNGGNRVCIPLFAGERWMGVAILADRVNGVSYTVEELDLLKCIGDQLAAALLNLRLTEDLMQSKELEAFQTMSTFFVHDLKNAASSLNLTLRNLPVHFDDPEFRADALRGIGNTVSRIDHMIERLSALRNKAEPRLEESDLNELVGETLERIGAMPGVELEQELRPLPKISADREQIRSVITNLLLNAREALGAGGRIRVQTTIEDKRAVLAIEDNGSGMSAQFMKESLFRPFQSTKKKGLGIGMFQAKTIIEAHGGHIRVESASGQGTTFRVSFPIRPKA